MATLNAEDRRIEAYLTNFSIAYRIEDNVGDFVAPKFKVEKSSDKYLEYTKQSFRIYDNKISGREKAKEIDLKADEGTYTCEEYSLATFLSDRDVRNSKGVGTLRLKEDKVSHLKDRQIASREKRILDIAGSNTVVTQTADKAGAWATAASGTPVADIKTGINSIWNGVRKKANRIIVPFDVAMTMTTTDEWRDNFKYTQTKLQGVMQVIDALRNLGLEPMITGATGLSSHEGGASDPAWETIFDQKVLIFYAEPQPTVNSMTFMSSPFTVVDNITSYRVNGERGTRYEIYEEIDELLIQAACAYLLTDVI